MGKKDSSGQAKNPRGRDYLRAVQVILNSQTPGETSAVKVLDWARKSHDPETRKPFTDRKIISEALIALGEKYQEGFAPPPRLTGFNEIVAAVLQIVETRLEGLVPAAGRDQVMRETRDQVESLVQTGNLVGDSFRYEDDDD